MRGGLPEGAEGGGGAAEEQQSRRSAEPKKKPPKVLTLTLTLTLSLTPPLTLTKAGGHKKLELPYTCPIDHYLDPPALAESKVLTLTLTLTVTLTSNQVGAALRQVAREGCNDCELTAFALAKVCA